MVCPHCGNLVREGATVCDQCGAEIEVRRENAGVSGRRQGRADKPRTEWVGSAMRQEETPVLPDPVLASRRRFAAQAWLLLHSAASPRWADWIEREVRLADDMFNGFLVGKLIDSVIMGVLCLLGTSLMGFNSAVLISTIVGVTNIIPFFGPIIGAVPCALLLLLENPLHALYFVLFIIVLQQLDGNFIGPLILGDSTGLSGFWVMFAILFFGGLWGVPGMILGVPLFALISDIFRQVVYWGLRRRGREDMIAAYEKRFHDSDKTKPRKQRRLLRKARQLEKKAAGKKAEE